MSWFFTTKKVEEEDKKEERVPTTPTRENLNPPIRLEPSRESRKELFNRIALNIPKLELQTSVDGTESEDSSRSRTGSRLRSVSNVSESSYDEIILTEVTNVKSKYLQAVIISVWDNTFGPKTLKVWHGLEYDTPDDDLIKFVTHFPLFGEVGREDDFIDQVEIKFNLLPEKNLMVLTCYFMAHYSNNSLSVYTINLIMEKSLFARFMNLNHILDEKMKFLGCVLQQYCNLYRNDINKAINTFHSHLVDFLNLFDSLISSGLSEFGVKETFLFKKEDKEFLGRVITSHLLMHGYTVVIGEDPIQVNRLVNTLSLFLFSSEKNLCKNVTDHNVFTPELYVQGIVTKLRLKEMWKIIPVNAMMSCRFPISIVDLVHKQIWRWKGFHHFVALQNSFKTHSIHSKKREKEKQLKVAENISRYTNCAITIDELLNSIFKIDSKYRIALIHEFMSHLLKKSILLIRYVEKESLNHVSHFVNAKNLKEALDYGSDVELLLVLSIAEKIKKGIYTAVEGDIQKESNDVLTLLSDL